MPLPPALAARLAKRGILKSPLVENGQSYFVTVAEIGDRLCTVSESTCGSSGQLCKRE